MRKSFSSNRVAVFAIAACAAMLAGCLERSNPFDPINFTPARRRQIQLNEKPSLDSIVQSESGIAKALADVFDLYRKDSAIDSTLSSSNAALRARNRQTAADNAATASANALQSAPDSLKFETEFSLLDTLKKYGPYPALAAGQTALQLLAAQTRAFMSESNARYAPQEVYPSAYRDSVLAPFVRDSLSAAALVIAVAAANNSVADSNASIRLYNAGRDSANRDVRAYNDVILFKQNSRGKTIIVRSDSLQAGTFVAKAGDTLYLGPGSFNVDLRFTNSGTVDSPIVVRGYPGNATVLKATGGNVAILSGRKYIQFIDLVFRNSGESGVKLEASSRNIAFRHCVFDSNAVWGLEVIDSDLDMRDCEVRDNSSGLRITSSTDLDVSVHLANVLIARNRGVGIEAVTPLGEISNCTISDNDGDGVRISAPLHAITLSNDIISFNRGTGLYREPTVLSPELFTVKACDLSGNTAGDWSLGNLDSAKVSDLMKANLAIKPEFIDAEAFDYGLQPGSALADFEKAPLPVVIGYRKPQ